jgi:hypothetical protein
VTEAQWLNLEVPDPMLRWLQKSRKHRPTRRKLGLFACACARRQGDRIQDEATIAGLGLAERLAEGLASPDELRSFLRECLDGGPQGKFFHVAAWAVRICDTRQNWTSPEGAARNVAGYLAIESGAHEPAEQCRLLREVIGNPYRPVAAHPAWRDPVAVALARAAYDHRLMPGGYLDAARLAVLCDSLLDAGCPADHELLLHLRERDGHVRGCWAVDLLLGKE